VAAARAEAAWLYDRTHAVAGETDAAFELALTRNASWPIGELAHWRWRAGLLDEAPPGAAAPYAAQIAGHWARAAAQRTRLGCPYERAFALADSPEEADLRRALVELQPGLKTAGRRRCLFLLAAPAPASAIAQGATRRLVRALQSAVLNRPRDWVTV
jgi:hypothetical protein